MARGPLGSARGAVRHRLVTAAAEGAAEVQGHLVERVAALERALAEQEERAAARQGELLEELRRWERRQRRDVMTAMDRRAAESTAELFESPPMHGAVHHFHPHDTLRHAVGAVQPPGMALEFGVATGTTLRLIVEHHAGGPVFGFDSFEGLPEDWRLGFGTGTFAQEPPDVRGAELVVGLFGDTLPGFLDAHPGPVSFLHLDADLYSSTATVLELVGPRLVPGSVVLFDEYCNYPGWQQGEHRAWREHVERTGLQWSYLGLTLDDEQVSVVVR